MKKWIQAIIAIIVPSPLWAEVISITVIDAELGVPLEGLEVEGMDWFGNWAEGWTEARFAAEGELILRMDGTAWVLEVEAAPKIENPTAASIRLYGDYFEGDKALALLAHRWDRIQAADELLHREFPDAWFDYAEPRKINFWWDLFAPRVVSFQQGVRAFLFPELYGYPRENRSADRGPFIRAESVGWDASYKIRSVAFVKK